MSLNVPNVPDSSEELQDKNTGAFSVPLNGVPKVKQKWKNEEYNECSVHRLLCFIGIKSGGAKYEQWFGQSEF